MSLIKPNARPRGHRSNDGKHGGMWPKFDSVHETSHLQEYAQLPQSPFLLFGVFVEDCQISCREARSVHRAGVLATLSGSGHSRAANSHRLVTRSQRTRNVEKLLTLSDTEALVNDYVHKPEAHRSPYPI
jgi:hypothetical protein